MTDLWTHALLENLTEPFRNLASPCYACNPILDRLVYIAHRFELNGESMRIQWRNCPAQGIKIHPITLTKNG